MTLPFLILLVIIVAFVSIIADPRFIRHRKQTKEKQNGSN